MSKVINYYVLIHSHKHGDTPYVFKTTQILSTVSENVRKKLAKKLKIEYEPEKNETLVLEIIETIPKVTL